MMILTGDCRELMPAHGPFDIVRLDPPYGDMSLAWDRQVSGWPTFARIASVLLFHGDPDTQNPAGIMP